MKSGIKLLFCLVPLFMMFACSSSRKATIVSSHPPIVTDVDSVRSEYIERLRIDTIHVTVKIPEESVKQIVSDSISHIETNFAISEAWINPNGTLGHLLFHKPQSFDVGVPMIGKDTETKIASSKYKEVPVPYPEPVYMEKELSAWQKFRLEAFWYLAAAVFCSIGFIFRRSIVRWLSNLI